MLASILFSALVKLAAFSSFLDLNCVFNTQLNLEKNQEIWHKFNNPIDNYKSAISLKKEVKTPNDLLVARNGGDSEDDLANYDREIQLKPRSAEAYRRRGFLKATRFHDIQGALSDYNLAIQLDPHFAKAYYNRGRLRVEQFNDPKGALSDYNRSIQLAPTVAEVYYQRGRLKIEQFNDPQGNLSDYNRAIQLLPDFASGYNDPRIWEYRKLSSDSRTALAELNRAILLDPYNAYAYYTLGKLKAEQLQDPEGALEALNRAIQFNPRLAIAYYNRGKLKAEQLHDPQGAVVDYDRSIEISPYLASAWYSRWLLKSTKIDDWQSVIAYYDRAIQLDPHNLNFFIYKNRAFVFYELGNITAAANDWQKSIAISNDQIESNLGLAIIAYKQGNWSRAIELRTKVLRLDKRYGDLQYLKQKLYWSDIILRDAAALLNKDSRS